MKISLAQMNPIIGDIRGNLRAIFDRVATASTAGVDLVVFPEMCITGYPPKDLLERTQFVEDAGEALNTLVELSAEHGNTGIIVGLPVPSDRDGGKRVANTAVLISGGKILHSQNKALLPTYDVFDEARYFNPAMTIEPVEFKDETLGISICEDAWNDPKLFSHRPYDIDPIDILAKKGASILINISASPFTVGKEELRFELIKNHAKRHKLPFVVVNQVGGNDELIFDGQSMFIDGEGVIRTVLPMFEEATETVETEDPGKAVSYRSRGESENVLDALILGTRDYFRKCGYEKAVIGLSGGIDSAVTLFIAVRALGPHNVLAVAMPSPHTSRASMEDSAALAKNLNVGLHVIGIEEIMNAYNKALSSSFEGTKPGIAEENIQARIRGNILMAYSNKFGHLLLSTGNKSELAVGYCTLYGDMSGGLAVISDVPKMMVYRLADFINHGEEIIPRNIIEKAPSAELKPGQTDQDTLPPYETLDKILDLYVEEGLSSREIIARGHDADTAKWVINAVKKNEYKRKQAALGLKVTSKAFGVGRRFPIAARYNA